MMLRREHSSLSAASGGYSHGHRSRTSSACGSPGAGILLVEFDHVVQLPHLAELNQMVHLPHLAAAQPHLCAIAWMLAAAVQPRHVSHGVTTHCTSCCAVGTGARDWLQPSHLAACAGLFSAQTWHVHLQVLEAAVST